MEVARATPIAVRPRAIGPTSLAVPHWVSSLVLLALIILVVELALLAFQVPEFMLPRPSSVFTVFVTSPAYFWPHLQSTLRVMFTGIAAAFAISFVLATIMAHSRIMSRGLFPILVILKLIPTIAVAPLIIIWFGFGLQSQAAVVAFITFFPLVVNLYTGLTEVDKDMIALMRSQGANTWQIFTKLRVPHSLPYIFTSLRTVVPLSSIGAIVGEWVGATHGIGYLIKFDSALFKMPHVFAALLTIALVGMILFGVVVLAESRVRRYRAA